MEWDYEKGNLDAPTKRYSVEAGKLIRDRGGVAHFFCVGRVLEQADVSWLQQIVAQGHRVGNHTYDHVDVTASEPEQAQARFRRAPWLVAGRTARELVGDNIRMTTAAMAHRVGIEPSGFRTPYGFACGLDGREDVQRQLLDLGFPWVSSQYPEHKSGERGLPPGDDVYEDIVAAQRRAQPRRYPTGLVEVPMSPISDVYAFREKAWQLDHFLKAVRLALEWTVANRAVFDFLCHPSCMHVEDPDFATIRLICDIVQQAGDAAELVGLDEIARACGG